MLKGRGFYKLLQWKYIIQFGVFPKYLEDLKKKNKTYFSGFMADFDSLAEEALDIVPVHCSGVAVVSAWVRIHYWMSCASLFYIIRRWLSWSLQSEENNWSRPAFMNR